MKVEKSFLDPLEKIMEKKEFSRLPREDVNLVYDKFDKEDLLVEEKVKLTRDLLRKMYTAFVSEKLLNVKDKDAEWFLKKHISTRERLDFYGEVYGKVLKGFENKKINVVDFGCGINGFSFEFFKKKGFDVNYLGTEPVGQLCDLQNVWFEKRKMNARVEHLSLFDLEKNFELIKNLKGIKIGFFFKVLDSLEMLKRNYSKDVLNKLVPMFDRCVVSWATRSLGSKKKFYAGRKWLRNFIFKNFEVLDEVEIAGENYIKFCK